MDSQETAADAPKQHWLRSNIEAFTVAIVMALIIKNFAFEAFQVPTGSMEPTIIGRNPGGDRIIVSKLWPWLDEPERYQVLVFQYPLSRSLRRCFRPRPDAAKSAMAGEEKPMAAPSKSSVLSGACCVAPSIASNWANGR